jgi:hypothetical protein
MFRARRTALDSAGKDKGWSGNRFTRTLPNITAAADTALPFFDPSVKFSRKYGMKTRVPYIWTNEDQAKFPILSRDCKECSQNKVDEEATVVMMV